MAKLTHQTQPWTSPPTPHQRQNPRPPITVKIHILDNAGFPDQNRFITGSRNPSKPINPERVRDKHFAFFLFYFEIVQRLNKHTPNPHTHTLTPSQLHNPRANGTNQPTVENKKAPSKRKRIKIFFFRALFYFWGWGATKWTCHFNQSVPCSVLVVVSHVRTYEWAIGLCAVWPPIDS